MDIFTELHNGIDKTAADVVQLLYRSQKKLATAESCTGGLISAAITSISGSSEVFDIGICTYANGAKMKYLDVPADVLEKYGAVSDITARLMAKGILSAAKADIAVSVTGIAGPTGGSEAKPVGTVYIGIADQSGEDAFLCYTDPSSVPNERGREYIRLCTVLSALKAVKERLQQ